MNGDKPPGIVPEASGDGSGRPSNWDILSSFAYPVGGAVLMGILSDIFSFSTALWIMLGLAACMVAVIIPILLRRNRKYIQSREGNADHS
jgi:hypothetical protein